MTRISSYFSAILKDVLPLIVDAVWILFAIVVFKSTPSIPEMLWVGGMGVMWFAQLRPRLRQVRREVWRFGDELVVRDRGIVARVELADCVNVTESFGAGRQITLTFREPTEFGTQITFYPHDPRRFGVFPLWSMSPFADDLVSRIEAAKRNRAVN